MDGRISFWLAAVALALGCAGCIPTQGSRQVVAENPERAPTQVANAGNNSVTPPPQNIDHAPKRAAKPATEISYGLLRDGEADSDAAKKNPEVQAELRDKARQAYQQALKMDPNNLEAHKHLAKLYTKMGDFERALEVYKKIMPKHPKDASLWHDLGMCHHRRKDFNESARCYQKALELEPENRDYLKKFGLTLAWLGQTDHALAYLTRAQGAALANCNIAGLLIGRGQRELALQHVRRAERIDPNLPQVRELLADLGQPMQAPDSRVATQ